MMELHVWHLFVGPVIALVGFYGVIHRTWLAPHRKEREELIAWRTGMEAKDKAHETRMGAIEDRLDDGKAKFETVLSKLNQLAVGQAEIKTSLSEHRRECEGKK